MFESLVDLFEIRLFLNHGEDLLLDLEADQMLQALQEGALILGSLVLIRGRGGGVLVLLVEESVSHLGAVDVDLFSVLVILDALALLVLVQERGAFWDILTISAGHVVLELFGLLALDVVEDVRLPRSRHAQLVGEVGVALKLSLLDGAGRGVAALVLEL